jgi:hypothetical protein
MLFKDDVAIKAFIALNIRVMDEFERLLKEAVTNIEGRGGAVR